jgi:hypothetical protein
VGPQRSPRVSRLDVEVAGARSVLAEARRIKRAGSPDSSGAVAQGVSESGISRGIGFEGRDRVIGSPGLSIGVSKCA